MNLIKYLSLSVFCASLAGCASYDTQTHHKVHFYAEGPEVVTSIMQQGAAESSADLLTAPFDYVLDRSKTYVLRSSADGYKARTEVLPPELFTAIEEWDVSVSELDPTGVKEEKAPVKAEQSAPVVTPEEPVAPETAPEQPLNPPVEVKEEPAKALPEPAEKPEPEVKAAEPEKAAPATEEPVIISTRTLKDLKKELELLKQKRQLNLISQAEFDKRAAEISKEIAILYK